MIELTTNTEIIGFRTTVCRNIFDAITMSVIKLIQFFHKQRLERIKTD